MTIRKALVGLAAASMLAAVPALAGSESPASTQGSNVEKELAEMRELVEGLKARVEAQEEQLGHQTERLEEAQEEVREQRSRQLALEESALQSSLSEFWGGIDVNMSVAGSYAYNFENPDLDGDGLATPGAGANQGTSGAFYPFHGDHNSFQVDQVWLDIIKESTEESRGGFGFTALYGNTASFLGQGGNGYVATNSTDLDGDGIADIALSGGGTTFLTSSSSRNAGDSTSDYYIHQAYVTYLAPGNVEVKAGKFATLIGAEVADTTQNFNITNGNIYNLFQPIDHTGVLTSTSLGPINLAAGVVNEIGLGASSPDPNKEKGYLGHAGWSGESAGVGLTVAYAREGANFYAVSPDDNSEPQGLADVVATLDLDGFEAWLNADYLWNEGHARRRLGRRRGRPGPHHRRVLDRNPPGVRRGQHGEPVLPRRPVRPGWVPPPLGTHTPSSTA